MTKLSDQKKRAILNDLKGISADERAALLGELQNICAEEEASRAIPFPKCIKLYLHGSEENLYDEARALGIPDDERWNPVYEVELIVEVTEEFKSKIVACDGYMIDYNKPFKGETVKVE